MKKSSFVAMILGVISVLFFGMGMSMTMISEWNAFTPGVAMGCVGLIFALITVIVWRKMENKAPVKLNGKTVLTVLVGMIGALVLGVGMCMVMIWSNIIAGIFVGIMGIVILICLIPLTKGIK